MEYIIVVCSALLRPVFLRLQLYSTLDEICPSCPNFSRIATAIFILITYTILNSVRLFLILDSVILPTPNPGFHSSGICPLWLSAHARNLGSALGILLSFTSWPAFTISLHYFNSISKYTLWIIISSNGLNLKRMEHQLSYQKCICIHFWEALYIFYLLIHSIYLFPIIFPSSIISQMNSYHGTLTDFSLLLFLLNRVGHVSCGSAYGRCRHTTSVQILTL